MNIEQMSAGRELDALVAEKAMGYVRMSCWTTLNGGANCYHLEHLDSVDNLPDYFSPAAKEDLPTTNHWEKVPNYSTDIASAWQVVEYLSTASFVVIKSGTKYYAGTIPIAHSWERLNYESVADTAPLAICYAALEVVKNNESKN